MAKKNDLLRLVDNDGIYRTVVTKSDGVFMQDGNTTLTTKMNEVTSQLEQIANEVVYYYLNNTNNLKLNTTIICNGFYEVGDMPISKYKVRNIVGNENYIDIGNGVLIGEDCSIKINSSLKLKLIEYIEVYIEQLGATPNNTSIKSNIIINNILLNYSTCRIGKGRFYLYGSILHRKNSKIIGTGVYETELYLADNVNKYPIKSPSYEFNTFTMLYDYFEIAHLTLNGNCDKNNVRDYSKNVAETYWGFGIIVTNVKKFIPHDLLVKNTESWGIAYFVCNELQGYNLEFDQKAGNGSNKDGITGQAKFITLDNIKGFTDDDLVGITNGNASLQGKNCGVNVRFKIENINVNNLHGLEKDGYRTHYAFGIYCNGDTVVNAIVNNITGKFNLGAVRIADYWYSSGKRYKVYNLNINNISAISNTGVVTLLKDLDFDNVTIKNIKYTNDDEIGINITNSQNCNVANITHSNITFVANNKTELIHTILNCDSANIIEKSEFNGVYAVSKGNLLNKFKCIISNNIIALSTNNIVVTGFNNDYIGSNLFNVNCEYYLMTDKCYLSSNAITSASNVSLNSSSLIVRGSILICNLDFNVNITDTNIDNELFDFSRFKIKFLSTIKPVFKTSSTGIVGAMKYDKSSKKIYLINPSLTGITAGTHRIIINFDIPLE